MRFSILAKKLATPFFIDLKEPEGKLMRHAARVPDPDLFGTESLADLCEEAAHCRACHLYKDATQTVFGEGAAHAPIMLVSEQPGPWATMVSSECPAAEAARCT
jgi:hypothetical protein